MHSLNLIRRSASASVWLLEIDLIFEIV